MIRFWDSSEIGIGPRLRLDRDIVYKYNTQKQFKPQTCLFMPISAGCQKDSHWQIRTRKAYLYIMYTLLFYGNAFLS